MSVFNHTTEWNPHESGKRGSAFGMNQYYSLASSSTGSENEITDVPAATFLDECHEINAPTVSTASYSFNPPDWFVQAMDRISELEKLPPNWDSYGSPPINPEICRLARDLFGRFWGWDLPVPFIAPVSGGGLYFKIKTTKRELEMELSDPKGKYASCLCVVKYPREILHELTIRLDHDFNQKIKWLVDPTVRLFT